MSPEKENSENKFEREPAYFEYKSRAYLSVVGEIKEEAQKLFLTIEPKWPQEKMDEFISFLGEHVANAILHGNLKVGTRGKRELGQYDEEIKAAEITNGDKLVKVWLSIGENRLWAKIKDEGDFNPETNQTPDPLTGDGLYAAGGRGLFIFKAVVDKDHRQSGAGEVTFWIDRDSSDEEQGK